MALEIFKLIGSIMVDNTAANESISKTDEKAGSVAETLAKGVGTAAKWGTAIVGGATAAATAIIGVANSTASTADEIDKASIRMGVSAEDYQRLAYAAGQCGVETSALEKAAKKLEGTDINMDDAMKQIMALGTAEERSAKAAELFGDSIAYTLSPLIEQSGEDFDGLINRADELGLVMSGDAVSAGVKLGDTMADIKKSFGAMATSIGTAVLPIVQQFADMIIDFLPDIQGMISQLTPIIKSLADALLPPLMNLVQSIMPILINFINQLLPVVTEIISAVLPVIVELLNMILPPLMEIVEALLPVIITLMEALSPILDIVLELLKPILDVAIALLVPLIQLATEIIQPIIDVLLSLIQKALEPLMPILDALAIVLKDTLGNAFNSLKPVIENIKNIFIGLMNFIKGVFTGNWKQAWSGIVDIFKNLFSGVANIFKVPINTIITGINKVFASLGSITVPDWVPGIGGASFSLPQIPMLAKGGTTTEAGRVLVGEQGPEFLDLPKGATVTPLDRSVGNIDYEKLAETLVDALKEAGPLVIVGIEGDPHNMFKLMIDEDKSFRKQHHKGAFVY